VFIFSKDINTMTDIRQVLAKNMKNLRSRLGITQEQLAERANLTHSYIGAVEIGQRYPKPETLEKIAKALGVDTPELFSLADTELLPGQNISLKSFYESLLEDYTSLVKHRITELMS
jgi:transcriptional regulator with XRE-family HTH domain